MNQIYILVGFIILIVSIISISSIFSSSHYNTIDSIESIESIKLTVNNAASHTSLEPIEICKHQLLTTSSNPQTTSSNPQTTSSNPQTTSSNPQTTSYNQQTTSSNPQTTSSNPQTTSSNPQTTSSGDEYFNNIKKYDTINKILNNFEDYCKTYFIKLDINLINSNLINSNLINSNLINSSNYTLKSIISNFYNNNNSNSNLLFNNLKIFLDIYLLTLGKNTDNKDYNKTLDLCLLGYFNLENIFNNNNDAHYIYNKDYEPNKIPLKIAKIKKDGNITFNNLTRCEIKNLCENGYYTSNRFINSYIQNYIYTNYNTFKSHKVINIFKQYIDIGTPEEVLTQILLGIQDNNINKMQKYISDLDNIRKIINDYNINKIHIHIKKLELIKHKEKVQDQINIQKQVIDKSTEEINIKINTRLINTSRDERQTLEPSNRTDIDKLIDLMEGESNINYDMMILDKEIEILNKNIK